MQVVGVEALITPKYVPGAVWPPVVVPAVWVTVLSISTQQSLVPLANAASTRAEPVSVTNALTMCGPEEGAVPETKLSPVPICWMSDVLALGLSRFV